MYVQLDSFPGLPDPAQDDRAPGDPEDKGMVEHLTPTNKYIILETDDSSLIDFAVQQLNVYNKGLQKKIMERVAKKEAEEEVDEDSGQVQPEA